MKLFFIDFRIPNTKEELCKYIGIPEDLFEYTIAPNKHISKSELTEQDSLKIIDFSIYGHHKIAKRNKKRIGEFREVWEPYGPFMNAYKSFNRRFDLFLSEALENFPHPAAFGFVRGKNTLENAQIHIGAKLMVNADIENFFPSISKERLYDIFVNLEIKPDIASLLSEFVTINGTLPQGFPSSPMLANLACLDLDEDLQTLARKYDCQYTRYADDMTFSGSINVPSKDEISTILTKHEFSLSEKKFRTSKLGQSHYVTGLSVSDPKRPRIPRKMKRRLRQELYYCRKFGIRDHLYQIDTPEELIRRSINRIDGYVRYVSYIEQDSMPNLRKDWARLLSRDNERISYASFEDQRYTPVYIFIDESEITWDGKKYLALNLVATENPKELAYRTMIQHRKFISDPYADGDVSKVIKKGIHFVDATEDLKKAYVGELEYFSLNAYTVFCEVQDHDDYANKYEFLLKRILPHRLMHFDNRILELIFEENSKIKLSKLQATVDQIVGVLKQNNNRHPIDTKTIIGTKAEYPQFAAPDFFLGVWGKYAKMEPKNSTKSYPREQLMFERLRDKQRVILNADTGIVFSRKRPFKSFNELSDLKLM